MFSFVNTRAQIKTVVNRQVPRPATTAERASLNLLNWKSAYKVYSEAAGCRKQTVVFVPQHKVLNIVIYNFTIL